MDQCLHLYIYRVQQQDRFLTNIENLRISTLIEEPIT